MLRPRVHSCLGPSAVRSCRENSCFPSLFHAELPYRPLHICHVLAPRFQKEASLKPCPADRAWGQVGADSPTPWLCPGAGASNTGSSHTRASWALEDRAPSPRPWPWDQAAGAGTGWPEQELTSSAAHPELGSHDTACLCGGGGAPAAAQPPLQVQTGLRRANAPRASVCRNDRQAPLVPAGWPRVAQTPGTVPASPGPRPVGSPGASLLEQAAAREARWLLQPRELRLASSRHRVRRPGRCPDACP